MFDIDKVGEPDELSVDGRAIPSVSTINRTTLFDLGRLSGGQHDISIRSAGFYAFSVSIEGSNQTASETPAIEYERGSNEQYIVRTNSTSSIILELSENYNSWWEATIDGEPLEHLALYSQVNGYIVPPGEHTVSIHYRGQETYCWILAASFGSAASNERRHPARATEE